MDGLSLIDKESFARVNVCNWLYQAEALLEPKEGEERKPINEWESKQKVA